MTITVTGPDGVELEFPDGTSRETMKAAMAKRYGGPAMPPKSAAPSPRGLLETMAGNFMAPINHAVAGVNDAWKRDQALTQEIFRKPLGQKLRDTPVDIARSGASVVNVGLNAAGVALSPIVGAMNVATQPAAEVVGGAMYDAGFPAYETPFLGVPRKLNREESIGSVNQGLTTAIGMLAPAKSGVPVVGARTFGPGRPTVAGALPAPPPRLALPAAEEVAAAADPVGPATTARAPDPAPSAPPRMGGGSGPAQPTPPGAAGSGAPQPGTGNPPRLTKAEAKAAKKILQMAKAANIDPQALVTQTDLLPVQQLGRGAEGVLKATARRPGATAGLLDEKIAAFDQALPENFRTVAERSSGVDRDFIAGDIDSIVAKAQKAAKPLYDSYAELGPMSSPELEALLSRPSGREYLTGARRNALDVGADPHDIEVMTQMIDGLPTNAGPMGKADDYVGMAEEFLGSANVRQALKRSRGASLTDWLAETGGLADLGGDVAAMDGHIAHRGVPFKRKLVREGGRGLDDAAVAAWEAGYFPDRRVPPGPQELMELIRKDLAGEKTYARAEGEVQELAARVEDFERKLARYEIDPTGKSAKQIAKELADEEALIASYDDLAENGTASLEPGIQVVERPVPTPRVLYDIKRYADADKLQRDARFERHGAHEPGDWARDTWYSDFRETLGGLVKGRGFDWDNLLKTGGEAPQIRKAFTDGKSLIEGKDLEALRLETAGWGNVQKKAALGGFIKRALDTGLGKQKFTPEQMRLYASDDFAARIAHLSGSIERGQAWQAGMRKMMRQAEIRGYRGGSHTGDIVQGNAELDAMEGGFDLRSMPKSKTDVANLLLDQGNKLADRLRAGATAETRNALGQQLLDREALKRALENLPAYERETSIIGRLTGPPRRTDRGPPRPGGGNPPRRGRSGQP